MIRSMLFATALLMATPPAFAAKPVKPGNVRLEPAMGYVLVRAGPATGDKGKVAQLYFWRYDPARQMIRTAARKDANRVPKGEDASFVIGSRPFEQLGTTESAFLIAVTPGEYVFHGTETTSFALGSYGFTVKPGVVTDIGTIHQGYPGTAVFPEFAQLVTSPDLVKRGYPTAVATMTAATETTPVPRQLSNVPVERAVLNPDRRFVNGGSIRPGYAGGVFANRMIGLPPMTSGDSREWVKALQTAEPGAKIGPTLAPKSPPPTPAKPIGGM